MDFKNFFQSLTSKKVLIGLGILIIVLGIFQAGIFVGYHKALFSYRWGDTYSRTFGGSRHEGFMMMDFGRDKDFSNEYGAAGKILKINLPSIIVEESNNIEKEVLLKDDTAIRQFRDTLKPSDLKVDDFIVVIGTPNDQAQVEAKLIRLLPASPALMMGTSTPR